MKLARSSKFAALAATGALALVGCLSGDSASDSGLRKPPA